MARILFDIGFLKVVVSHITRKPTGLYLYQRRIPEDLRGHYGGRAIRKQSLKTRDFNEAVRLAAKLSADDEALWTSLRSSKGKDLGLTTPETRQAARALMDHWGLAEGDGHRTGPDAVRLTSEVVDVMEHYFFARYGSDYERARNDPWYAAHVRSPQSFLSPAEVEAKRLVMGDPEKPRVLLSDALDSYLDHKSNGRHKFEVSNRRFVAFMTDAYGDLPLGSYTRQNVNDLRDKLIAGGATTATVKRYFKSLSAIFNHAIDELDLKEVTNPFKRFKVPKAGHDARNRPPFTADELSKIAAACRQLNDDIRHLVALQVETGARIGEIAGLRIEDVSLDGDIPHIFIRPHARFGRRLKTAGSERRVPLVGISLWGAQRALEAQEGRASGWLFPRYASDDAIRADNASNAVAKWLRDSLEIAKGSHSFRHSIADRLRAVEAPDGIVDAIGGWKSQASMARSYGQGHLLEQLKGWLERIAIS